MWLQICLCYIRERLRPFIKQVGGNTLTAQFVVFDSWSQGGRYVCMCVYVSMWRFWCNLYFFCFFFLLLFFCVFPQTVFLSSSRCPAAQRSLVLLVAERRTKISVSTGTRLSASLSPICPFKPHHTPLESITRHSVTQGDKHTEGLLSS